MRRVCGGFLLLILIFAGYSLFCERMWLHASYDVGTASKHLYQVHLPDTARFCVRFKHSVALTPVEEWFVAQDGQIALQSTVYEDFGAGLPHDVAEGQEMLVQDGKVIIHGYTLRMQALYVRVGRVAEHTLMVENASGIIEQKLRLDSLVKPGTAVKFTIVKESFFQALCRDWKNTHV